MVFDYDGTLTPIVGHPDLAILAPETKNTLVSLSQREKYLIGIVSGRSLADVTARVDVPGLIYAGNHGLEITGPGLRFVHPKAMELVETQRELYRRLRANLMDFSGVVIEDKGLTLSVHYRMAPYNLIGEVDARFNEVVAPFLQSGAVKITRGKMVLEVRPDLPWDKGKAIAKLQAVYSQAALTLFFGDDLTDEDGFTAVQDGGGIGVFVGLEREPTKALFRVDSPQEVVETLRLLGQI